jgi:Uma2 family endonuclease
MAIHPPKTKLPRRPSYLSKYHGLRMTEEQYLVLPEEKPYLEYVDGVVLQKPMPNSQHRKLVGRITYLLGGYVESHGGDFGPEGRVALGAAPNYRLPDTAYWAPGRPSGDDSLPTLAVEVRSPDQTLDELRTKCRFYRANGVDVCWLADPATRTVEVFEGERDAVRLPADATLESPLLRGFSVPLAKLFAVLDA